MGRLRNRLDRIENSAQSTMFNARQLIAWVREAGEAFVEDLSDGVRVEVIKEGDATLFDFFQGKVNVLPFKLRLVISEDKPKETEKT